MAGHTSIVSRCWNEIRIFLSLEAAKDFKMPIATSVAAISLSAISMGVGLGFIPVIWEATSKCLEKHKNKKPSQMTEKEQNDLLRDLTTRIYQEMYSNEKLRQEMVGLLNEAMRSDGFKEYLKQNQRLFNAINNRISLLIEDFPELKGELKIIQNKINQVVETINSVKDDTVHIREVLEKERIFPVRFQRQIFIMATGMAALQFFIVNGYDIKPTKRELLIFCDDLGMSLSTIGELKEAASDESFEKANTSIKNEIKIRYGNKYWYLYNVGFRMASVLNNMRVLNQLEDPVIESEEENVRELIRISREIMCQAKEQLNDVSIILSEKLDKVNELFLNGINKEKIKEIIFELEKAYNEIVAILETDVI